MARRETYDADVVELDLNNLEKEWASQPRLMRQACGFLSDAKKEANEAKHRLDLVYHKVRLAVKRDPARYGWAGNKAPTVDDVESLAKTSEEYQLAVKAKIEADHREDVLGDVVTALHHKKSALEAAVTLWARGYFSDPQVPEEHREAARGKLDSGKVSPFAGLTKDIDRDGKD